MSIFDPVSEELENAAEAFTDLAENLRGYMYDDDDLTRREEAEREELLEDAAAQVTTAISTVLDAFRAIKEQGVALNEPQERPLYCADAEGNLEAVGTYAVIDQLLLRALGNAAWVHRNIQREIKFMDEVMDRVRQRIFVAGAASD